VEFVIHVFHGFLGSPQDFSFLPKREEIKLHDLLDLNPNLSIESHDTLIGYSMGGRIALELAHQRNFDIKKLVLIGSHPGLSSVEERQKRALWEDEVLSRLESSTPQEFESYWNSLSVFEHDQPIRIENQKLYASLFDHFRLSRQENFLPYLKNHRERLLWIVGSHDEKYRKIAQETLAPLGIATRVIDGGHRLFQNSDSLLHVLKEEGIL